MAWERQRSPGANHAACGIFLAQSLHWDTLIDDAGLSGYVSRRLRQDEVALYTDLRSRREWDKLSEFFAIIKTTEHLENARIKSAVGRDEVSIDGYIVPPNASTIRVGLQASIEVQYLRVGCRSRNLLRFYYSCTVVTAGSTGRAPSKRRTQYDARDSTSRCRSQIPLICLSLGVEV